MNKIIKLIIVLFLVSGCFLTKKEAQYNWPVYQVEETKRDTSGVELKTIFYEYYRQTTKEEFIKKAEEIYTEHKSQHWVKIKKGQQAKLLNIVEIKFYFQNKYPYKSTKGNVYRVVTDTAINTNTDEWLTYLGKINEEGFEPNQEWWEIALIKRVPKKDN